jgi:transposase-like protein
MANAERDVLAYMGFPAAHRDKLHSTNPIERLNGEIKRHTEVVGIFPDEAAITVRRRAGPSAPSRWRNPKNGPSGAPAP